MSHPDGRTDFILRIPSLMNETDAVRFLLKEKLHLSYFYYITVSGIVIGTVLTH